MLPTKEVVDHPVIEIVWQSEVASLLTRLWCLTLSKAFEKSGYDMDIVVSLKQIG